MREPGKEWETEADREERKGRRREKKVTEMESYCKKKHRTEKEER